MPISLHRRQISGSFNLPIQGAFQLSITLLLRYRSRDMFSLGGGCPPDSREISDPRYSRTGHVLLALHTGLSPSMIPRSRGVMLTSVGLKGRLTTPHLPSLSGGIRFRLCCVHSPLLTASLLISFPAPTQMFQLRAFPTITGHKRILIRRSRAQRLHAPPPGLSQLGTSFIGPRAKPST
jgi:hypothetical protein